MRTIAKNTTEWWNELNRLAGLLNRWAADRENEEWGRRVVESLKKLGLVVPAGDEKGSP